MKADKPFFLWHNSTRCHVWTHLSPKWKDKSGFGIYADAMMELDWIVGEILQKLDDEGIADNTIVMFTSDNGAEIFSWPDGGNHPFRGEKGTVVCYADRFTPKDEHEKARDEDREARTVAFLKRFVVFNVDQCERLPDKLTHIPELPSEREAIPQAEALIRATGADFRIGRALAFYSVRDDYVEVPPQQAFHDQINFYRTALHELGHWTGHPSRLNRDQSGGYGTADYAREELVAETLAF